ncbi:hypothetical protein EL17_14845 [Anditalea andensis]|uniref:Uncharacterized protein n=1 Tax=Anditalea andensis TaxID=1048983 RepID=A0A074KZ46_9BACT|nr:hypothetical protein EL17_14845 [Anditalea andensis]
MKEIPLQFLTKIISYASSEVIKPLINIKGFDKYNLNHFSISYGYYLHPTYGIKPAHQLHF